MNSFEFLEDYFFGTGNEAFHISEVTHEELIQLINFGFDMEISRGRVFLDKNKSAMAKLILDDIWFEDEVGDVIEYRFLDKDHAALEIETVYMQDESKSIKEIREDVLTDWHLTEEEKKQRDADYNDDYQTKRHPDEANFSSPLNAGRKLSVRGDDLL